MQQAHLFYSGGRIRESAEARKIMAFELMEDYKLSPNEIDALPYTKIKEIFLFRRIKSEARHMETQKEQFRRQHRNDGRRGGGKRSTREV